jgi:hypothetical protein
MLSKSKTLILSLTALLFFSAEKASAQYAGMGAFNRQMNNQFMNQQMNNMMRMNSLRVGEYADNPKYDFTVVMKDSSKKVISSKIHNDTTLHKDYLLLVDKSVPKTDPNRNKKIYADQTLQISRVDFFDKTITGLGNDSCWMFKVVSGPISAYSYLSDTYNYYMTTIIAIQTENSPITHFTVDALKLIIATDPKAMKKFDKNDYLAAIKKYNDDVIDARKKSK